MSSPMRGFGKPRKMFPKPSLHLVSSAMFPYFSKSFHSFIYNICSLTRCSLAAGCLHQEWELDSSSKLVDDGAFPLHEVALLNVLSGICHKSQVEGEVMDAGDLHG